MVEEVRVSGNIIRRRGTKPEQKAAPVEMPKGRCCFTCGLRDFSVEKTRQCRDCQDRRTMANPYPSWRPHD